MAQDAIEQTTYLRITEEVEFTESTTADGDYEINFGTAATVALTPDAAEKLFSVLSTTIPLLRQRVNGNVLD